MEDVPKSAARAPSVTAWDLQGSCRGAPGRQLGMQPDDGSTWDLEGRAWTTALLPTQQSAQVGNALPEPKLPRPMNFYILFSNF